MAFVFCLLSMHWSLKSQFLSSCAIFDAFEKVFSHSLPPFTNPCSSSRPPGCMQGVYVSSFVCVLFLFRFLSSFCLLCFMFLILKMCNCTYKIPSAWILCVWKHVCMLYWIYLLWMIVCFWVCLCSMWIQMVEVCSECIESKNHHVIVCGVLSEIRNRQMCLADREEEGKPMLPIQQRLNQTQWNVFNPVWCDSTGLFVSPAHPLHNIRSIFALKSMVYLIFLNC